QRYHGREEEAARGEGRRRAGRADRGARARVPAGAAERGRRGFRPGRGPGAGPVAETRSEGALGGAMKILAIAEQRDGALRRASHEVVSEARRVADAVGATVDVVVLGPSGIAGSAGELGRYGADRILVAEGDQWAQYGPEPYTAVLAGVIGREEYFAVFLPATARGKDLAPRLAARLDLPLATDATALSVDGGELIVTRPLYAGKVFARVKLNGATRLVSLRPNAFG